MTRSGKHTFFKRLYSGYVKSSLQISFLTYLMFPPEAIIEKDNEMKDPVDLRNGFLLETFGRTRLDLWVQKRHVLYLLKPQWVCSLYSVPARLHIYVDTWLRSSCWRVMKISEKEKSKPARTKTQKNTDVSLTLFLILYLLFCHASQPKS